jgi:hypothetical protein
MKVAEGPELLELGSRVVLQGRRWGFPQRVVSRIVEFVPNEVFADEQVEGPFRKWLHRHEFAVAPGGTRVTDRIDFEPPGGALGLLVTASFIERDLKWIFDYRSQKLRDLLGTPAPA